jgi:hypothetical protein
MTVKVEIYASILNPKSLAGHQWVKPEDDDKRDEN